MLAPDSGWDPVAIRDALEADLSAGVNKLAEFASRYASNRELVSRAVLLKRQLSRRLEIDNSQHLDAARTLLADLMADLQTASNRINDGRLTESDQTRAEALEATSAVVLECDSLGIKYRRGRFSLKNVSFSARAGEIVGLFGRNGTGKTTLFRAIAGELRPTTGVIRFPTIQAGVALRWSRVWQRLAYVPQELPAWYGSLLNNLHYEAAVHGVAREDNRREVDFIIERLNLAGEIGKKWDELSGGNRLRFALARALVWRPTLLLLDEPLAHLDPVVLPVVLKDLRLLANSRRHPLAVLVSSQHIHEVEEISDKLLFLDDGNLKYDGSPTTLGRERRVNRFEIAGALDFRNLREVLDGLDYDSLHHNGLEFVLTTSTDVSSQTVLRRLLTGGLTVTHFRDVSRSAKVFFGDPSGGR